MSTPLPPIYRDCRRLLVLTEDMVRRFSRYHKYTVGADLRQSAMGIMRTCNQAVHDKLRQTQHVQALVWLVDDFKLTLQLCMDVGVFAHGPQGSTGLGRSGKGGLGFHFFEQAATLAAAVGKQCGGWGQALARRQRAEQVAPDKGAGLQSAPGVQTHPASLSGRTSSASFAAEGKP